MVRKDFLPARMRPFRSLGTESLTSVPNIVSHRTSRQGLELTKIRTFMYPGRASKDPIGGGTHPHTGTKPVCPVEDTVGS